MTYQQKKDVIRNKAIKWQMSFNSHCFSYSELADFQNNFEKLAKKYGLIKEFKENAII